MDITPSVPKLANVIDSYGNKGFKIRDVFYPGSQIISMFHLSSWEKEDITLLNLHDLCAYIKTHIEECEVLLVGIGEKGSMYPAYLRKEQRNSPFAIDIMDTGAACRTYNVLLAEGRKVVAALIAV